MQRGAPPSARWPKRRVWEKGGLSRERGAPRNTRFGIKQSSRNGRTTNLPKKVNMTLTYTIPMSRT
eukprot:4977104-Heterocapsa_arctica.AAC.1